MTTSSEVDAVSVGHEPTEVAPSSGPLAATRVARSAISVKTFEIGSTVGLASSRPAKRRQVPGTEWGFWELTSTERRIRTAWDDMLARFPHWSLWATLTYRLDLSSRRADRHPKLFARALGRLAERHVIVACAGEPQLLGRPHFHALIGATDGESLDLALPGRAWRRALPSGLAGNVKSARPHDGCIPYLTAHPEPVIEIGCSRPNFCKRKFGCLVDRGRRRYFEAATGG